MSESSTETESMSGGEEEMTMMSITDVIPVGKNLGEVARKEPAVVFAKDKPVSESVKEYGLKNGSPAARAKCFLSQNRVDDVAANKNASIARCDDELTERHVKKEREGYGPSTQMVTLQEQMVILEQEQCR